MVRGCVYPLTDVATEERWVRLLRKVGCDKTKLFVSGGDGLKSEGMPLLFESIPDRECIPYVSVVSWLGFHFNPSGFMFRSVRAKEFHIWKGVDSGLIFYVANIFDANYASFRYGQPIVALEGVLDAEGFVAMTGYPFVIAYLSSGMSPYLAAFVSSLTDKVLLVPDNDEAGRKGADRTEKYLHKFGVGAYRHIVSKYKDFGDVLENSDAQEAQAAGLALNVLGVGL